MSDLDPTDIDATDDLIAAKAERDKILVEREIEDFKWFMSDKRGRRIMWKLLSVTGVFRNPFRGTRETDFLCGVMHVGQQYLADITEHAPERYNQMVTENAK